MRDLGAPRQHLTVGDCTGCHALSVITRTCRYAELVHPGKITRQPDTLDDLSPLPTTAEQPPSPLTFPPGSPSLPSRCRPSPSSRQRSPTHVPTGPVVVLHWPSARLDGFVRPLRPLTARRGRLRRGAAQSDDDRHAAQMALHRVG